MSFAAHPEHVSEVRRAVAAFARQAGLAGSTLADLQTIVTEACMNAAAHAYAGGDDDRGIEVSADVHDGRVAVMVRDRGDGIRPRPAQPGPSRRLGLVLIAALADTMEIRSRPGRGTEVRATIAAQP